MEADRHRADRLLKYLCWAAIVCFLTISAFDIHQWRVDAWRSFDEAFAAAKLRLFDDPPRPLWLYAVAFPVVATNFGCTVQLLRGKRRHILLPFLASAASIAAMPLLGSQGVIYRPIWADILSLAGYGIAGAIGVILYFGLDSRSAALMERGETQGNE